jgi:hypothetical protein
LESVVMPDPISDQGLILSVDRLPGSLVAVDNGPPEEFEAISLTVRAAGQVLLGFLSATPGKFVNAQVTGRCWHRRVPLDYYRSTDSAGPKSNGWICFISVEKVLPIHTSLTCSLLYGLSNDSR